MDKNTARKLVEDTFNKKFDEEQFTLFIKNFLNDIEPRDNAYSGQYIWDAHKDHINTYKRIGKYVDPEGEALDVLIVEVKSIVKLERARTALRNFVIKHLSKFDKDFALAAFYSKEDDGEDWRFSFVKLEHQSYLDEQKGKVKTRKEFTPAKRYSFLVGKHEDAYTAKNQLLPLLQNVSTNPTVEDIENAFSIEKVTDEFFLQYKDLYVKLFEHFTNDGTIQKELVHSDIDTVRFTKKLLGQIVFLYFLQKKGWLGVPKNQKWGAGNKRFIQNLFDTAQQENKNFYKEYLQYLFYEALAKERDNENSYYERFDCRIPFLNGGLFEAEYNWQEANITIPEHLFRNDEKNKSGDTGTGVLDVFDRYNFTIKEDEPLDKEVAVDPEMLGKVFENMLEVTERKSKGAFYTPREIVHYMCQESLIHYLDNALNHPTPTPPLSRGGAEGGGVSTPPSAKGGGVQPPTSAEAERPNINNLPHLKTFRKQLRSNLTPAEAKLWSLLKGKQLEGRKFRRQFSVANYILDFYCPAEKLAVELDGQPHFEAAQADYDYERDLFLNHVGIKVLRFENKWIWDNPEGVLDEIKRNFGWKNNPSVLRTAPLKGEQQEQQEQSDVLVPRKHIEQFIKEGHFALENDQRVAMKGKETKDYKYVLPECIRSNADLIDKKLTEIKICDPAIGSGAFPVGLLHELVTAHLVIRPHLSEKYFTEKLNSIGFNPEQKEINESRYIYRLKRHIIQESIYGVDIDASAIDIARLRLWLSLIVDEDDLEPIETLPNLDYKIVCGNSLIGLPENAMRDLNVEKELEELKEKFYDETNETEKKKLRSEINSKIRALLHSAEAFAGYKIDFDFKLFFSEVWHEKGGFDVVIGNPPYGVKFNSKEKSQLRKLFPESQFKIDSYSLFILRGLSLNRNNGYLCYITPSTLMDNYYEQKVREKLLNTYTLDLIIELSDKIFSSAVIHSMIIGVIKNISNKDYTIKCSATKHLATSFRLIPKSFFISQPQSTFSIRNFDYKTILQKLNRNAISFENVIDLRQAIKSGNDNKYISDVRKNKNYKPMLGGKHIKKWQITDPNKYIYYGNHLACPRDPNIFEQPKILLREAGNKIIATLDVNNYYIMSSLYNGVLINNKFSLKYVLALLNSEIFQFLLNLQTFSKTSGAFTKAKIFHYYQLPIKITNESFSEKTEQIVDFLLSNEIKDYSLIFKFFETLLNGVIYEIYFSEEIKEANKEILKHLEDVKPINDDMSDEQKLSVIQSEYERLSHPEHPVRINMDTLDEVEEVRIIREALK
jgi:very-short-patch-repair endonuclease/predicted RNA methylase